MLHEGRAGVPVPAVDEVQVYRGDEAVSILERRRVVPAGAGFWQRPEWHVPVIRHLVPRPESLFLFDVSAGGAPAGFMLLSWDRRAAAWRAPLYPHVDVYDAAVAEGIGAGAVVQAVLRRLAAASPRPWSRLVVGRVPCRGPLGTALLHGPPPRLAVRPDGAQAWFALAPGTDPLAGAGARFRRNLRRLWRRLERRGGPVLEVVSEPSRLGQALETFMALEASGWKGPGGTRSAIGAQPRIAAFYRDLVGTWGRRGACRIHLLRLGGRPVAGHLALVHGDTLSLLKIGYDAAVAELAPGVMLLYRLLLEEAARGRFRRLSLVTDPPWARRWAPRRDPMLRATVFNDTLRATVLAGWETAKRWRRRILGRDDTLVAGGGRLVP